MPRRKKDAIIPLPNELEKKESDASLTKVEIALEKVKQSKQKPKTIIIEEQSDEDDDVEYIIQPLQPQPTVQQQPQPTVQQQPQPSVQQQPQPTVQQQPQPTVQQQPIEKPKQKRTYTKKPKPAIPIQQPQPQTHNDDILKQLDILRKENENLKTQNSLSNLSRLSTMARTMRIQF